MDDNVEGNFPELDPDMGTPAPDVQEALSKGWKPKDQWDGEGTWYPHDEFLRRGELLDKISKLSKTVKGLQKRDVDRDQVIRDLVEHNQRIAKREYDVALRALNTKRAEALSMMDTDTVVEVEAKIEELKEVHKSTNAQIKSDAEAQAGARNQQSGPHPAFAKWVEENPWYHEDPVRGGAADRIAQMIIQNDPEIQEDPEALFSAVSKEIAKRFPEGGRPRRAGGPEDASRSGTPGTRSKGRWTASHLNREQYAIAKRFADQGIMKIDEYAQQLGEAGEL